LPASTGQPTSRGRRNTMMVLALHSGPVWNCGSQNPEFCGSSATEGPRLRDRAASGPSCYRNISQVLAAESRGGYTARQGGGKGGANLEGVGSPSARADGEKEAILEG